jgi:5-methylcytosine-specific restriction protein A
MTPKLRSIGQKLAPSTRVKVRLPDKKAAPFYLTPEWRALMDAIIVERFGSRANARCQDPECKQPQRRGGRIFGDHVREVKDGGALLDKRNILCVCGSCHTRKTAAARAQRFHTRGD